jgi:hypothetical protein
MYCIQLEAKLNLALLPPVYIALMKETAVIDHRLLMPQDGEGVSLASEFRRDAQTGAVVRLRRTRPLSCTLKILGVETRVEIITRTEGACFFFHARLGHIPFTAQPGEPTRQDIIDVLRRLGSEMHMITSDVDLMLTPQGEVHLRGSLVTDAAPTLATLFTAVAEYTQGARPFLLELRPMLVDS